jgi:hypothetical protein
VILQCLREYQERDLQRGRNERIEMLVKKICFGYKKVESGYYVWMGGLIVCDSLGVGNGNLDVNHLGQNRD